MGTSAATGPGAVRETSKRAALTPAPPRPRLAARKAPIDVLAYYPPAWHADALAAAAHIWPALTDEEAGA